ncbi:MAG: helix-turn-helix domain-containing protein [Oscillibacter sp.]|nr:helix-turn-helix domain-containing protein [Oscillibacter sp.]
MEEYVDVLTTDEACEVLRVGYNALYKLLNSGKLEGCRSGRVWRIPKVAVRDIV